MHLALGRRTRRPSRRGRRGIRHGLGGAGVAGLPPAAGLSALRRFSTSAMTASIIFREMTGVFLLRAAGDVGVVLIAFAVALVLHVTRQIGRFFLIATATDLVASGFAYAGFSQWLAVPTALLALPYLASTAAFVRAALWTPEARHAH